DRQKLYGNVLELDGTALVLRDKDDDAILPNGASIDAVLLASVNGIDADTARGAGTYIGELAITGQKGSAGFDASNYVFTYVDGALIVSPRPITVSAQDHSKAYGDG